MNAPLYAGRSVTVTGYRADDGTRRLLIDAPGDLGGPPSLGAAEVAALVTALRGWLAREHAT